MIAHEKALQWQELFDLAVREGMADEDILSMGYRVGGNVFFRDISLKYD